MQENSRYYYTANIPAILRSHPLDSDRIAEAENRSSRFVKKYYPDSVDYPLVKELKLGGLVAFLYINVHLEPVAIQKQVSL